MRGPFLNCFWNLRTNWLIKLSRYLFRCVNDESVQMKMYVRLEKSIAPNITGPAVKGLQLAQGLSLVNKAYLQSRKSYGPLAKC